MKKGFTLIELLAVIVILAIIALIATPIILNIINDARLEGRNRSAESLTYSIQTGYLSALMLTEANGTGGVITVESIIDKTQIDNEDTRDSESITTKDGVKCTIEQNDEGSFVVTCIDTKSNDRVILTKELVGNLISINQDYVMKESGLLCNLGGRKYYKTNAGTAFIAYYYFSGTRYDGGTYYSIPIIVSKDPNSVVFGDNHGGNGITYGTTVEYNGETYYVSSTSRAQRPKLTSGEGPALKLSNEILTPAQAAILLLKKAYNEE